MATMNLLTLLVVLAGLLPTLVQGFWKMPCYGTIVRERIDPVMDPGLVSDHLHRVVGGSGINFTMNEALTRRAGCSSCIVVQDKSNYLVPQLYSYESTLLGPVYTLVEDGSVNITYTQIRNDGEIIHPFPESLTMTAGNPYRRSFLDDAMANAISFRCDGGNVEFPGLPESCTIIVAAIRFPNCWNGRDATSENSTHMSYDEAGICPSTHPVRVMTLRYDFEFDASKIHRTASSNKLIFSMGDDTGYGFHGVFINGWNTTTLSTAINTCVDTDTGDIATTCDVLTQYDADQCIDCKVPPRVDEPIDGVGYLPGSHDWSNENCTGRSIGDYQIGYENLVPGGWQYEGCSSTADPFGINQGLHFRERPDLTPSLCRDLCQNHNVLGWFALHDDECTCSKLDPKPANLPAVGFLGNCDTPCPGNHSFTCGGLNSTSLYKHCDGTGDVCHNYEFTQWPTDYKRLPKRFVSKTDEYETIAVGGEKRTVVDVDEDPASNSQSSDVLKPVVSGARLEGSHEQSVFIGYKVCARHSGHLKHTAADGGITCSVIEGSRAESVAAAFIDWAIAEYALDAHAAYASPEDVLDARIAQLRMAELHRLRPRVMGMDAVLAVLLVSSFCLLGITLIAKNHELCGAHRRASQVHNDIELATRLLDMDPAVFEMLFAKYAALKARRDELELQRNRIVEPDREKDLNASFSS
ncbi:wsc domain protein [Diplodia corticola]|uniref:Wsc domain protein n=1 Tax=Diplodia corticola TaxID=236234 RepID=A0A1J9R118_9PEZI|nr:wsc domain protein [Diplodia corticola]OJD34328.1 wsc domain protein [Diplodia corticola]